MSLTTPLNPQVVETYPKNYQTNVSTKESIKIYFDIDLDIKSIQNNVIVQDENGVKIEGTIYYPSKKEDRAKMGLKDRPVIIFTPTNPFSSLQIVKVRIIGDDLSAERKLGIRSATKYYMIGDYNFTFTVANFAELQKPILTFPQNESLAPALPNNFVEFGWNLVPSANYYQIQISDSRTFNFILFPTNWEEYKAVIGPGEKLKPAYSFSEEKAYYWRVRAVKEVKTLQESRPIPLNLIIPAGEYLNSNFKIELSKTNILKEEFYIFEDNIQLKEGYDYVLDELDGVVWYRKNIISNKSISISFKYITGYEVTDAEGPWSEVFSFYRNIPSYGVVAEEDTTPPDPPFYFTPGNLTSPSTGTGGGSPASSTGQVNFLPKDNQDNVSIRLNKIMIEVPGQYTAEQINESLLISMLDIDVDYDVANLDAVSILSIISQYNSSSNITTITYNLKEITTTT